MSTTADTGLGDTSSIFTSPIITVLAGTRKQPIAVYSAAFKSSSSPVLRALLSENWKEGQDKEVDWSHTDVSTVSRVISYLYTKDYEVEVLGKSDLKNEKSSRWQVSSEMCFHNIEEGKIKANTAVTATKNDPKIARPLTPVSKILGDSHFPSTRSSAASNLLSEGNLKAASTSDLIYTYLTAHVQVYIFAQSHLMRDLERLALERTSKVLQFAEKTSQTLEALNVVEFVYENTARSDTVEEPMRKLLSHFIVLNMKVMNECKVFSDLIRKGGDFAADVCGKMYSGKCLGQ